MMTAPLAPLAPFRILPCPPHHVQIRASFRALALSLVTELPDSEARRYLLDQLVANRDDALVVADAAKDRAAQLAQVHRDQTPEGAA